MRNAAGADYSIYLCDPFGTRLADASHFVTLKYARTVNTVGSMVLTLPGDFDTQLIRAPDGRIEVWRRLSDSPREYLETDTTWLIKAVEYDRDDKGRTVIRIEADTPLCILGEPGRVIDYAQKSTQAAVTGAADNVIKQIVRDNAGSSATTASRSLAAYLSVAPNTSQGPTITRGIAYRSVLKVLQEIARMAAQDATTPTYLAFDITAPTPGSLLFQTYIQQRGVDHRFPGGANPVIFGPDFGNMGACILRTDWRGEVTFAVACGVGINSSRVTSSAEDDTRIALSPFGLREKVITAHSESVVATLTQIAAGAVRDGRPKTKIQGQIISTPDTRYGVHWGWGDYVTVQAFGQSFNARIDAIAVTVEHGKETINAVVRYESS